MLELRLLGTPEVLVAGRNAAFRTRNALVLVAYLATEPGPRSRERLAGLLWPDADPQAGRARLRGALGFAREALGPAADRLKAGRASVELELAPGDRLDVADLEAAAGLARLADAGGTPAAARLSAAALLVRGEFLEGVGLPGGGELDDWLAARREAARYWADLVLDRLSAAQEAGDPAGAAETAARWTSIDRLNEAAWRRLASARAAAGQAAAAREALAACRRVLRAEVGAEPSPETLALEARLERQRLGTVPAPADPRATPDLPSMLLEGRLVGRDTELAQLVQAHRSAARGRPNAVLIAGEPGIGKTRLAREFRGWAEHHGTEVLRGRAFESAAGLPFGAVVDALRRLLARELDPIALLGRGWSAELSGLLPELRDEVPDLPPPTSDRDLARSRLLEAIARALLAVAGRAPLVVVVDDLQWADGNTLEALRYAARRLAEEDAPALLVLTARAEALGPGSALAAWVARLTGEVPVLRLVLGELALDDTRRLLAGLGDAAPEDAARLADWLQAETGGHPLYLTEALRGLVERGAVARDPGGLRVDFARLGAGAQGVRAVIAGRLARLSPAALAVAEAAATLGERSAFEALCATAGLAEDDAAAGLDELLLTGLLREARDGGPAAGSTYLLSHDRVRETAYAALSGPRRRVLHRRALAALEALHAGREEPVALQLSRHAQAAGDAERARAHLRRAGLRAARLGAAADALPLLERALELTPATPENHQERVGLLSGIAGALDQLGGMDALESLWRGAAERAREAGLHREYAEALARLASALGARGRHAEAEDAAQRSASVALASGHPAQEAHALLALALNAIFRGDVADGEAMLERSLAVAREADDPACAARALHNLGVMASHRGEHDLAQRHTREALGLAREFGLAEQAAVSLVNLAQTENYRGDRSAALEHFREAQAEARRAGRVRDLWHATLELGGLHLQAGDPEAVEDLESALELARSSLGAQEVAAILPWLGRALAGLGEGERARAMLEEARGLVGTHEDVDGRSGALGAIGELALALGDVDEAEDLYRRALDAQLPGFVKDAAAGLAEVLGRRGDSCSAAKLLGFLQANPPAGAHEREQIELALERLRAAVPGPELEDALECGRGRSLGDVVAEFAIK